MTPEYEIPPFRIREYGKTELAVLYSPHLRTVTAVKKLRRWIRGNRPLMAALAEADYNPRRLSYTPREVELIVRHLAAKKTFTVFADIPQESITFAVR